MATIVDTVKSCFTCEMFDYIFSFPPNDNLNPRSWLYLLAALFIILPLTMIAALTAVMKVKMRNVTKIRIWICYFGFLVPLILYIPRTFFHGLRDPAIRSGTWFERIDGDTLLIIDEVYGLLTSTIHSVAMVCTVSQEFDDGSDKGKKSAESEDKKQAEGVAEEDEVMAEKMKVFIVNRLKE